jgi:predicted permease
MQPWNSIRNAVRQLLKRPALSLTVIVTLALCIGANTAIYTVVDALFFRPLPYPQPNRLVLLTTKQSNQSASDIDTSQDGTQWELIRDNATLLDAAVYGGVNGVNLVANNQAEFIRNHRVGAGYFRVLGVPPVLGRELTRAEDVANGPNVAVISYDLWQRAFHGDPALVGRAIDLRGTPYTVIGVAQPGFRSLPAGIESNTPANVDVWTPLHPTRTGEGSGDNYGIVARLKPGVTLTQADGQLNAVLKDRFASRPMPKGVHIEELALPLETGLTNEIRSGIQLLWGAVLLVLLIGCVNIAGILLASSASRTRELATRLALGAGRTRIVAELFTESLLLALSGGIAAVLLGEFAVQGLAYLNPAEFNLNGPIHLSTGVAIIALLISLATSLLFGLFPAFEASAVDLRAVLAEGGRSNAGSRRQGKRQLLVFAEVTLSVVLVVSAGLLVRTFLVFANAAPGFDPAHLTIASASLQDARYATSAAGSRLFRDSLNRIQNIPGVESAAVALSSPYSRPLNDGLSQVNGQPTRQPTELNYATPEIFTTLRMQLLQGSAFSDADNAESRRVAVVNEAFLRRFLMANNHPIGSSIRIEGKDWQVMGIVNNVQETNGIGGGGPIGSFPEVYVPVSQFPDGLFAMANTWFSPVWIVRTRNDDPSLPQALQRALSSVDPRLPFSSFKSMSSVRSSAMAQQFYHATIFSVLAGLAILLAAIGLYGLIAQSVEQRKREMGIRLALGASVQTIVRAAVAPGLILSALGVVCGSLLALLATKLLKGVIWGVAPNDPATFVSVALLLLLIAGLSSLIPVLRLTRIDPAQTLREE